MLFTITVFLLAGLAKGVLGLGLPTVAMALLTLRMMPAEAAALMLVPSLATNLWQIGPLRELAPLARRLAPLLAASAIATLASASILAADRSTWPMLLLGGCLAAYGVLGLVRWRPRVSPRHEAPWSIAVGAVTGLATGATGVFVVPVVAWLHAIDLGKDRLVQALALSFTVSTLALAVGLASRDALAPADLARSLLMLPAAFAGMAIGRALRDRLDERRFRTLFLAALVVLGAQLVGRSLVNG
ncbi:sulfite exporter TauE/SafE family protein [Dokdonella sp. MW10]|uniref:sulfite exporter TauE/SafE family protein n=1 Tax=Dokdonella sp. MW10 TaxID=2992926 RepID=UPI003F7F41D8